MVSGRKRPADDTSVPVDLLRMLLHSLEAELLRAFELRERLHMTPEPSHEEHATSGLVAEALGTRSVEAVARTGLLARVGLPGEAVAVRAELDVLPVQEETGSSFAATNGFMHACGHDVHMAALAALFRAAGRIEGSLPKPLAALFQPSEEAYPLGADALDPADRQPLRKMAREIIENTARAHGCVASIEVTEEGPATVNDPALAEAARSLLPEAGFELASAMRSCGSDDFGFYGRTSPTLMLFVGIKNSSVAQNVPLHHPRFLPPAEAVGAVARAQAVAFVAAASAHDQVPLGPNGGEVTF